MTATDSLAYCAGEVRRYDYDRYLASLFAGEAARPALHALYAFNIEIAKTREVVSEPLLGEMRLQWWREALAELYGGTVRTHAVVEALAQAVARHDLSRTHFERLIEGRAADLEDAPPADLAALEAYAAATASPLFALALEALDARSPEALEAGRLAGLAWGLVGLVRAVPFHAGQGRVYLPRSLLAGAGIAPGDLARRVPPKGLREVVAEIAAAARAHLAAARALRPTVPEAARPALLPLALAEAYLDRLARHGHDPFDRRIAISPTGRQARLAWSALRGRY